MSKILLFSLSAISSLLLATPTHWIAIHSNKSIDKKVIQEKGYAIEEVYSDKFFILGNQKDIQKLQKNYLLETIKIDSLQPAAQGLSDAYFSYDEYMKQLDFLVKKYPELIQLEEMGRSIEDRPLMVARVSALNKTQANKQNVPTVVITGCHHARERMSVVVPLHYIQYLASEYATNPYVKEYLDTREVFIAPMINPDGYDYDFQGGNVSGKYWRKNRRKNKNGTYGVDLNRNYAYKWGTGGSSKTPSSQTYMGPEAFSEPETQALKDFIDSKPRTTILLNFHSYSELILYPWGYTDKNIAETDDDQEAYDTFKTMAEAMAVFNGYEPQQASDLYIASGVTMDWAFGEKDIFSFTFELFPKGGYFSRGFYVDAKNKMKVMTDNNKPLLYLLHFADDPTRALDEKAPQFNITPSMHNLPIAHYKDAL